MHKSHALITLTKLNAAPLDKFRESDATGKEIPSKPHVLNKKKNDSVADKPNHVIPYGGFVPVEITDSDYKIPAIKYRMSTVMGYFLESAAEMGINFLPVNENVEKVKKTKTVNVENLVPVPEAPKTSNSTYKKNFLKTAGALNPLRTTGFITRTEENN